MKKISNVIWGAVLIAAGVIFALNALGVASIDVFFDGWWSLFIIIPCAVGLFTEREKTGNAIGLAIGVLLLLGAQNVISFDVLWKLVVPVAIAAFGIVLIVRGIGGDKVAKKIEETERAAAAEGKEKDVYYATFSGSDLKFDGEEFGGAELVAVFGGIKCDLRGAKIEKNCVIKASAIFGGVDIIVPDGVNVKLKSTSIFGGASNKKEPVADAPVTLYVNATCMFGGVDIK